MDVAVLNAMRRWPNVPVAQGWLSLDARGRWRLHPNGGANDEPPEPGESITHAGLLAFINRNYACDSDGRWFFQNGPQRVYVRLDAAPYIVRLAADGIGLETHTGRALTQVDEWLLDEAGNLYLRSPAGPGRIDGRDLPALLERLAEDSSGDNDGDGTLPDALERGAASGTLSHPRLPSAPWRQLPPGADLPMLLGFSPR